MQQKPSTGSIRKAAILLASLDAASARALLAQLSPAEARLVRKAADELKHVSYEERSAIAAEFSAAPRGQQRQTAPLNQLAGIELDGSLATTLNFSAAAQAAYDSSARQHQEVPAAVEPFGDMSDIDSRSLARHLAQEQPQVVAVVVAHLPHQQAAQLLANLAPEMQRAIVRRLESLDDSDPESVREIERQLRNWLSTQAHYQSKRTAGKSAVAGIIAAADPTSRDILLRNLGRKPTAPFATPIEVVSATMPAAPSAKPIVYPSLEASNHNERSPALPAATPVQSFEELADLSSTVLARLLAQAEPELIALALTGANERVVQRFCAALPRLVANALQKALNHPGPIRLSDVAIAREELARLAGELANRNSPRNRSSRLSMAA